MTLWSSKAPAQAPPPVPDAPESGNSTLAQFSVASTDFEVDSTGPTAPVPSAPQQTAPNCPLPRRPPLSRQTIPPIAPAPPSQLPPPSSAQQNTPNLLYQSGPQPTADSLSLAQLRRLVNEFPRGPADPIAYDFVYADQGPHEEEIDEWFNYQEAQWNSLDEAQIAFDNDWANNFKASGPWEQVDITTRANFTQKTVSSLISTEPAARRIAIQQLLYLVLGRWADSADGTPIDCEKLTAATESHIRAIKEGVALLTDVDGVETVWKLLQKAFELFWMDGPSHISTETTQHAQAELRNLLTIMFLIIHETLHYPEELSNVAQRLRTLKPSLVDFALLATANLRWDDQGLMPQNQVLLLFWKSLMFTFGGAIEIKETKKAVQETEIEDKSHDLITASPLDYHVFRQEITSKYPAYVPPQPKLPLAAEQTSYLPRLPNHPVRDNGSNGIYPALSTNRNIGGASILHQPVHIATPAPSPPPSPSVGGKSGKKQNYQTNQNFPFMYPPLDATSNSAGGKGIPEDLEKIIGRRWEGSDIPASILEAGEIFSRRVRMTRATRQLWEEREKFLQCERGYEVESEDDDDIGSLDLDLLTLEERELIGRSPKNKKPSHADIKVDFGPHSILDERIRQKLVDLENFYKTGLPYFQSLVIVFNKIILSIVTSLLHSPVNRSQENGLANANVNGAIGNQQQILDKIELSLEELDAIRTREISGKAATGIVILLLKWLKTSHVLKFEYITQLLFDANFIPLILKYIAHQDVQYMVDTRNDRLEATFFHRCNLRARTNRKILVPHLLDQQESSEDDACPPPIRRRRSPPPAPSVSLAGTESIDRAQANEGIELGSIIHPEVDELGYPVNPLPKEPIRDYSWRNFFTLINFLRILQKMCKNKVHRNMLLVQYKSSNILRKALKVPQPDLRLYTLKLFKNQVPYCGRKWRQSNMRVITAVYLHCRPELRDEWLAGSDVDAEVEEAVPLEQALRSLTHFFNCRCYPDKMSVLGVEGLAKSASNERNKFQAPKNGILSGPAGEWGFFVKELEKIDWSWGLEEDGMIMG